MLALYPDNSGQPDLNTGTPDVVFAGSTNIEGLVLAGHSIRTDRNARIKGQVVAYTGDIIGEKRNVFTLLPEVVATVAGLAGFTVGGAAGSGPSPVTVLSWQRF